MRKQKEKLPEVGSVASFPSLPRDIRCGEVPVKGAYLVGWCETTETRQVWHYFGIERCVFIGFVVENI